MQPLKRTTSMYWANDYNNSVDSNTSSATPLTSSALWANEEFVDCYSEESWDDIAYIQAMEQKVEDYETYFDTFSEYVSQGFYIPSLADQLQSLGSNTSMIGSRLWFQMIPQSQMETMYQELTTSGVLTSDQGIHHPSTGRRSLKIYDETF